MPVSFGTNYTLAQGNSSYEYLRKNTWEVQIAALDSILLAKTVTLPRYTLDQGELWHWNDVTHFAMKPKPSVMTVELYDATDPLITEELWTWYNLIHIPSTGQMGLASTYKMQGTVLLYDPAGNLIRTWTATGMFPLNTPTQTEAYTYEDQNPAVINMNFSVDRVSLDGVTVSSNSTGTNQQG